MQIDCASIKAAAREQMRGARPRPLYEGVLFALVAGGLTALSAALLASGITPDSAETYLKYIMAGRYEDAVGYLYTMTPSNLDYIISYALDLLRGVVAAGLSIFAMNTLRGKEPSLWNLLDGFGRFLPLVLLLFLRRFLISVWAYLLLIPGVIAFYRYRLAVYLLLDHQELNALQSLVLSGRMMQGKKGRLFLLDLSFIGWLLLAFLPLMLGALFGLATMIVGAAASAAILAWLIPYYELSCVGFYEAVKRPLEELLTRDGDTEK